MLNLLGNGANAGKEVTSDFGRTWSEIEGATIATAEISIPQSERVGAYELRVQATYGSKTVNNYNKLYPFTMRKSGCPAPANRPKTVKALRALLIWQQ